MTAPAIPAGDAVAVPRATTQIWHRRIAPEPRASSCRTLRVLIVRARPAGVTYDSWQSRMVVAARVGPSWNTTVPGAAQCRPERAGISNGAQDVASRGADRRMVGTTDGAGAQQRGEQVDQRADMFAIGEMLWELCSVLRLPPADGKPRHPILRRAGIDRDLMTFIDSALGPDASRRHPDAGALAADLEACKAGARAAARRSPVFESFARSRGDTSPPRAQRSTPARDSSSRPHAER
jgi:hypothetical protein